MTAAELLIKLTNQIQIEKELPKLEGVVFHFEIKSHAIGWTPVIQIATMEDVASKKIWPILIQSCESSRWRSTPPRTGVSPVGNVWKSKRRWPRKHKTYQPGAAVSNSTQYEPLFRINNKFYASVAEMVKDIPRIVNAHHQKMSKKVDLVKVRRQRDDLYAELLTKGQKVWYNSLPNKEAGNALFGTKRGNSPVPVILRINDTNVLVSFHEPTEQDPRCVVISTDGTEDELPSMMLSMHPFLGPFMPSVFTRMFQKALTNFQEKGRLITTAPAGGANVASDTDGGKAARGR